MPANLKRVTTHLSSQPRLPISRICRCNDHLSGTGPISPTDEMFLLAKGGNGDSSAYFFDISSWNRTDPLVPFQLWPRPGSISYNAMWSRPVREPFLMAERHSCCLAERWRNRGAPTSVGTKEIDDCREGSRIDGPERTHKTLGQTN